MKLAMHAAASAPLTCKKYHAAWALAALFWLGYAGLLLLA
jgi:hypothetical protein